MPRFKHRTIPDKQKASAPPSGEGRPPGPADARRDPLLLIGLPVLPVAAARPIVLTAAERHWLKKAAYGHKTPHQARVRRAPYRPRPVGLHRAPLAGPGRHQALAAPLLDLHHRPRVPRHGRARPGSVHAYLAGPAAGRGRVRRQRGREDLHPGPLPLPPHPGTRPGPGDAGEPHLRGRSAAMRSIGNRVPSSSTKAFVDAVRAASSRVGASAARRSTHATMPVLASLRRLAALVMEDAPS